MGETWCYAEIRCSDYPACRWYCTRPKGHDGYHSIDITPEDLQT